MQENLCEKLHASILDPNGPVKRKLMGLIEKTIGTKPREY
jgi:hypothetical protein